MRDIVNNTELSKQRLEEEFYRTKRSRNGLFYIAVLFLLALSAYIFDEFFFNGHSYYIRLFLFANLFAIALFTIYWYLQIKPITIYTNSFYDEWNRESTLKERLEAIEEIEIALSIYETNQVKDDVVPFISTRLNILPNSKEFEDQEFPRSKFDKNILSNQTKLELFKAFLNTQKTRFSNELDADEAKSKKLSEEELSKEKVFERISSIINFATSRLKKEIELLSKRANIYIIFGSAITLGAGLVLYFAVNDILNLYPIKITKEQSIITAIDVFSVAIRLSIVIFIEIFAFYYLRLHKNILEDIKFYQNEITNIEMKILSMYVAVSDESKNLLVSELAKTERNFIISNKQTTINIEKRKYDTDIFKSTADSITKIIKSVKS